MAEAKQKAQSNMGSTFNGKAGPAGISEVAVRCKAIGTAVEGTTAAAGEVATVVMAGAVDRYKAIGTAAATEVTTAVMAAKVGRGKARTKEATGTTEATGEVGVETIAKAAADAKRRHSSITNSCNSGDHCSHHWSSRQSKEQQQQGQPMQQK